MRLPDTFLFVGVTASLVLTVTLVVTRAGTREPPTGLARMPTAVIDDREAPAATEDPRLPAAGPEARALVRTAPDASDGDGSSAAAARRREGRRREAAYLAEFLALRSEQGSEALERAVRDVIGSHSEPLSRRVAGLRALHSAGVPGVDAVLASAVESQPDVSDGLSLSMPRFALKLLFERAPSGEDAQRVLARLAFVQEAKVSADLRRVASTALAASVHGAQRDEVVRLLRLEANPQQLESALEVLSRDANFGAARTPLAALDTEPHAGVAPGK